MVGIIDFGSQYTQLIARKVRENGVFSKIFPYYVNLSELDNVDGLILSGGPKSVFDENSPDIKDEIWKSNIPILGICYGLHLIAKRYGGKVDKGIREYGKASLFLKEEASLLFKNIINNSIVWMSHGDYVSRIPENFKHIAYSDSIEFAAIESDQLKRYGIQFHPEVTHTSVGFQVLNNFLFNIVNAKKDWNLSNFLNDEVEKDKLIIKNDKVICGISGGVDSSVAALIIHKAIGSNLECVFVDHGLLRKNEPEEVFRALSKLGLNIKLVNKSNLFLSKLEGIIDPEEKRKIIGELFIRTFEEEAMKSNAKYLLQGTLYPDYIESSGGISGLTDKIKSHHNVGGLPEKLNLEIIEPLKYLFKDEVRILAKELSLDPEYINRHPFPGPGLAVRIIGEITEQRLDILREADFILREELNKYDTENKIWQAFVVLLPIKSVGVMGDKRSYSYVVALRMVESVDGMTAMWHKIPGEILERISNRITNEVKNINRVVYDITSKPPATIEWE